MSETVIICSHVNKVCKQLNWGKHEGNITVEGKELLHHFGNVDLWHCNDCNAELFYDWYTRRYEIAKDPMYVTDDIANSVWFPKSRDYINK